MPMPTPRDGESQEKFMNRCAGDMVMNKDYPDNKQRVAVCYAQWRDAHGGKKPEGKAMAGKLDKSLPVFKDWVEGPFGVPMPDKIARACEALAKNLPKDDPDFSYKHACWVAKFSNELRDGERSDISILTTGAIDRDREIVIPKGVDLKQFQANPIVTFNHDYSRLPIGKAQWIRYDEYLDAIKAKTLYEPKPDGWGGDWMPDAIFGMVRNGTMLGKSIGFLPNKAHRPTKAEIAKRPELESVRVIYDEVSMFEYSVVPIGSNPQALVEAVSKGVISAETLEALGIELPMLPQPESIPEPLPIVLPKRLVSEAELADAVRRSIRQKVDPYVVARDAVYLLRGGV